MPMQVRLFVSGGPDQEANRELLGLTLAEFPVNVGWKIKRTPDVDSVAESHLLILLLGRDIWAPVGLEVWWARRTEKPILAYRSEQLRTPAGQVFVQENAALDWRRCHDQSSLRQALSNDLARFLLGHAERYGLTNWEIGRLHLLLTAKKSPDAPADERALEDLAAPHTGGAGGGGVILAPGKDQPRGARLVDHERS